MFFFLFWILYIKELRNKQKNLVIEWATSTNDPDLLGVDKSSIFVGGLNPQDINEELLAKRFGAYGEIESSTLVNRFADEEENKGSQQRSAFAFIKYKDESSASSVIENENGVEWLDRRIRVQYCESQEMKNKRRANKYFQAMQLNSNMYYPPNPMMMMRGMPWYGTPQIPPMYPNAPMDNTMPYMMYPYGNGSWGYPMTSLPDQQRDYPIEQDGTYPNVDMEQATTAFSQMNIAPSQTPLW